MKKIMTIQDINNVSATEFIETNNLGVCVFCGKNLRYSYGIGYNDCDCELCKAAQEHNKEAARLTNPYTDVEVSSVEDVAKVPADKLIKLMNRDTDPCTCAFCGAGLPWKRVDLKRDFRQYESCGCATSVVAKAHNTIAEQIQNARMLRKEAV